MNKLEEKAYSGVIQEVCKLTIPQFKSIFDLLRGKLELSKYLDDIDREYASRLYNKVAYTHFFGKEEPILVQDIFVELDILEQASKYTLAGTELSQNQFNEDLRCIGDLSNRIPADKLLKNRLFSFEAHKLKLFPKGEKWIRFKSVVNETLLQKNIHSLASFESQMNKIIRSLNKKPNEPNLKFTASDMGYLIDIFEVKPKYIVLGRPGAGKTTLLKKFAEQCLDGELEDKCIPVFVSINNYVKSEFKTLKNFLVNELNLFGMEHTPKVFEELAVKGKLLILLDGLDEIDSSILDCVLTNIESFTRKYHKCSIIITCRTAFYSEKLPMYKEAEISNFNAHQIKIFAENWFDKRHDSNDFVEKIKHNIAAIDMANNPFLLSLLCLAYENKRIVREQKSHVIEDALDAIWKKVRTKFDSLSNVKGENYITRNDINNFLEFLAAEMFKSGDISIQKRRYKELVRLFFEKTYEEGDLVKFCNDKFINELEWNTGIIIERAMGIYTFSHLSFQEFLFAKKIVKSQVTARQLVNAVNNDKKLYEVFLLCIQLSQKPEYIINELYKDLSKFMVSSGLREYLIACYQNNFIQEANIDFFKFLLISTAALHVRGNAIKRYSDRSPYSSTPNTRELIGMGEELISILSQSKDVSYASKIFEKAYISAHEPIVKFNKKYHCFNPLIREVSKLLSLLKIYVSAVEASNKAVENEVLFDLIQTQKKEKSVPINSNNELFEAIADY